MKKIIGYSRVSSAKQIDNYSIAEQEKRIKGLCDYKYGEGRYKLTFISDNGKSGKTLNRNGMKQILKRIEGDEVDILVVLKLDRLCRNLHDMVYLINELGKKDKHVVSVSESIDTDSAIGNFTFHLMGALAELESNLTSERTAIGLVGKCETGEYPFSKPKWGYLLDENRKLYPDPKLQDMINEIYNNIFEKNMKISESSKLIHKKYAHLKIKKSMISYYTDHIINNKIYLGTFIYKDKDFSNIIKEPIIKNPLNIKKLKQNKYNHLNLLVICSECKIKTLNESAKNRSGKLYLYKRCPICKKRVNENIISDFIDNRNMKDNEFIFYDFNQKKVINFFEKKNNFEKFNSDRSKNKKI
ncbi:MAG: recombinase family protein [Bacilli bacterium]